jgi:predicted nucleotidyltransferase
MRARLAVVAPDVPALGGAARQVWRAGSDRACRIGRDLLIPVRSLGYGSGMVDGELISRAGRILAGAAQAPARVLLFGSHARGDARDGSDLDFLVIERDVANRSAEMVRLRDALPPLQVPVDVVVVSEQHVAKWGPVKGTLIHAALAEGRLVAES